MKKRRVTKDLLTALNALFWKIEQSTEFTNPHGYADFICGQLHSVGFMDLGWNRKERAFVERSHAKTR